MSRTYEFVCDDCKVHVWVGQSRYETGAPLRIYEDKDGLENQGPLHRFLLEHQGHKIRFGHDDVFADELHEYRDLEPDLEI